MNVSTTTLCYRGGKHLHGSVDDDEGGRMTAAVLFDLDGLLADTEPLHCLAYQEVLGRRGVILGEDQYVEHWVRNGRGIAEFLAKQGICADPEAIRVEKSALYRELIAKHAKPMPGALEILERLAPVAKLALASSSYPDAVAAVLAALDMSCYFDVVVTRTDVMRVKPEPDIFIVAARRLGVKPEKCVVIEDAEKGIVAAKRAGMRCLAVPNRFTRHHDFSAADMVVRSLDDINAEMLMNMCSGQEKGG